MISDQHRTPPTDPYNIELIELSDTHRHRSTPTSPTGWKPFSNRPLILNKVQLTPE